jgi:hypothetical protein
MGDLPGDSGGQDRDPGRRGQLGGAGDTRVDAAGLTSGEPPGDALLMVIGNPCVHESKITNVADQASRRT